MRHPALLLLTSLAIAMGALLASTATAAPIILSAVQLRSQFTQCGFEVTNPGAPPTNQYVVVQDPGASTVRDANYRIVMAIVYKDAEAANTAHARAHAEAEARLNVHQPYDDNNGPQLLVGYGGSVWRSNIALLETTNRTLASLYSYDEQTNDVSIARPELFILGFAPMTTEYAVDRDFVACLTDAGLTANNPSDLTEPMFMPGLPW